MYHCSARRLWRLRDIFADEEGCEGTVALARIVSGLLCFSSKLVQQKGEEVTYACVKNYHDESPT